MISVIMGKDHFYIIIHIFIEKHKNVHGVIFAGICTKQRCFPKSVEYCE